MTIIYTYICTMNSILKASIATLEKSKSLLNALTDEQLADRSVAPYYSCVGSHLRHVLDFYDCVLNDINKNTVDLTIRTRDERIATECQYATQNVDRIIDKIKSLDTIDLSKKTIVIDDLGLGSIKIEYTLSALFAQMAIHATHHYAMISYILANLGIKIKDTSFGYNATSPINTPEKAS